MYIYNGILVRESTALPNIRKYINAIYAAHPLQPVEIVIGTSELSIGVRDSTATFVINPIHQTAT